ncbi:hypothetical protein [Fulvivirga lutea]|uniref:Uncharacterized protein n=1 Tax=Fulvivirga lutea TaxID=2810512 RepID=A0A974ZZH1_9BACT|nr:hypothetical protein [Fulvivirga lutea]QSE96111.1 hypothetical protein JR347_10830 [Fulvivirga lutea]
MIEGKTISKPYDIRIHEILDESWKIFKSQFIHGRHEINKEAPFQHHFAQIIRSVGNLYSIGESDLFKVDLETKCDNIRGKSKYVDITCEFYNHINCAIELKFKTARQSAQDHGRVDAYLDIEAVEQLVEQQFDLGKFYMITDSTAYINPSKKGVGTVFTLHNKHVTSSDRLVANTVGRMGIEVTLNGEYVMNWEQIDHWYFLDLTINK